jgi:hypothetical protein
MSAGLAATTRHQPTFWLSMWASGCFWALSASTRDSGDASVARTDAMRGHPGDHARAFREYDEKLRPFIDEVQAEAVRVGLETLVPRTEEAIRERNAKTGAEF